MKAKAIIAIVAAGMMAVHVPMVAMAETTTINDTITTSTTADANVEVSNKDGINPTSPGTTVDLTIGGNGNVTVDVNSESFSPVSGVHVTNSNTVMVKDINVTSSVNTIAYGVQSFDLSDTTNITISTEDITATGTNSYGVFDFNLGGTDTIYINGDIASDNTGMSIVDSVSTDSTDITIVCTGTISADIPISLYNPIDSNKFDLTVYAINATNGGPILMVDNSTIGTDVDNALASIDYIIKTGQNSSAITITGADKKDITVGSQQLSFTTQKANNTFNVTVASGYDLTAGDGIIVSDDGNGNYVVKVRDGGGVTLEAILKKIAEIQTSSGSGSAWTSTPTALGSASAPISNGKWSFENGAFKYSVNDEPLRNTLACIKYVDADNKEIIGFYYFDKNGKMATGWQKLGDKYCYFDTATGAMLMNATTPDGYKVGADGTWIE